MQIDNRTSDIDKLEQKFYELSLSEDTARNTYQITGTETEVNEKIQVLLTDRLQKFISSNATIGFVAGLFTALENKFGKCRITDLFKRFEDKNLRNKINEHKKLIELEVQRSCLLTPRPSHLIQAFYEVTGLIEKNPRIRPNVADRFIYVLQDQTSKHSEETLLQGYFKRIQGQTLVTSKEELNQLTTTLQSHPGYKHLSSLAREAIQKIDIQFEEALEERTRDAVNKAVQSHDFLPLFSLYDEASAFGKTKNIDIYINEKTKDLKNLKDQLVLTYKFRLYESIHEGKPAPKIRTWLEDFIEEDVDEGVVANEMTLSNAEALFFAIHNGNLTKTIEIFSAGYHFLTSVKSFVLEVATRARELPLFQSSALLIPSIFEKAEQFRVFRIKNDIFVADVELLRIVVFAEVKMKVLYEKNGSTYFKKKQKYIRSSSKELNTQKGVDEWNKRNFNLEYAIQYDPLNARYFVFVQRPVKASDIAAKLVRLACLFFLNQPNKQAANSVTGVIELSAHYDESAPELYNQRIEGIRKEYQYAEDEAFHGIGLPPKPVAFLTRRWHGNDKESLFVERADGDVRTDIGDLYQIDIGKLSKTDKGHLYQDERFIYTLASHSIDGVHRMHTHKTQEGVSDPIAHFDIKGENILFKLKVTEKSGQENYSFHLIDFETASRRNEKLGKPYDKRYGTLAMTPPEMISTDWRKTGVDYLAADVWALGHTFYEVVSGGQSFVKIPDYLDRDGGNFKKNFDLDASRILVNKSVDKAHAKLNSTISDVKTYSEPIADLLGLIQKMLNKDPLERITIELVKKEFESIMKKYFSIKQGQLVKR